MGRIWYNCITHILSFISLFSTLSIFSRLTSIHILLTPHLHVSTVCARLLLQLYQLVFAVVVVDCYALWFENCFVLLQASGLAIFCAGIWMQVELHKYLELNVEYSNIAPYVLVGTGAFILLVSSLACCCTVKGHPSLLYTVSMCGRNGNEILCQLELCEEMIWWHFYSRLVMCSTADSWHSFWYLSLE